MPSIKLDEHNLEVLRDLAITKFKHFCQLMLPPEYYDPAFHDVLCDFLQGEEKGPQDKLVVMARVHLKTTIAATLYPLWLAVLDPSVRVLIVSNTQPNASKTLHTIKGYVEGNSLFQALFPELIPPFNKVRWSDECACVARPEEYPEGTFEAAGTGTNLTRRHYNVIIEDDTVAPRRDDMTGEEMLPSREDVEQAIGFHRLTIPLLIDAVKGKRVVIGTRWAAYDIINHIMENEVGVGRRFSTLDIPALNPTTGKPNYRRFSLEALEGIRAAMGPYMFSALYLNKPLSSEFMKFKPEWTRYFHEDAEGVFIDSATSTPLDMSGAHRVVTVDPADPPTGKADQCYSAIVSAVNTRGGLFVRRAKRGRFTDAQLVKEALDVADADDATTVRVEVDRYAHLENAFRVEMAARGKYYVVDAVKTRGRNKEARIMRLTPLAENGLLWLKKGMRELESEMYQFPRGATLDLLDALAWQVLDDYRTPSWRHSPPPPAKARRGNVFTFEEIQGSVRRASRRHACPLPFNVQLGGSKSENRIY